MIRRGKSNAGDSWVTPQWILDMFPTAFDPCPYNPDWQESDYDGLVDEWPEEGVIFINPPYSNVNPWIDRALGHKFMCNMLGTNITIVLLLKHDSSTKWFAKLQEAGARMLMFHGRLEFKNFDQTKEMRCSYPSILMVI